MNLADTLELFAEVDPSDRLELLIDYGTQLDALAGEFIELRDRGLHIVHECQAPVFFYVHQSEDILFIEVDVPEEAAIARGFATMLKKIFDKKPVPEKAELPVDLLNALRIDTLLGMQRRRGLSAIYNTLVKSVPG